MDTTPRLSEHVKVLGHDHILNQLIDRPMQRFTMDPRIALDGLNDGGDQPIPNKPANRYLCETYYIIITTALISSHQSIKDFSINIAMDQFIN